MGAPSSLMSLAYVKLTQNQVGHPPTSHFIIDGQSRGHIHADNIIRTKQVVSRYLGIYIIVYIIKETMSLRKSVIPTNRLSARDRIMV